MSSSALDTIYRDSFPAKTFAEETVKYWKAQGIEAVLVVATDEDAEACGWSNIDEYIQYLSEKGFEVMHLPVEDHRAPSNVDILLQALEWLKNKVNFGKKIVVHCYAGIGRTSTVLVCFLIKYYGLSPKEALAEVFEKYGIEPDAYSQYRFIHWFYENFAKKVVKKKLKQKKY
ncbi:MAG: hypothetical protein DRN04_11475 [Thermoprotei archaeon]|nr:MAG: hypothetical protein DRN04_11475 [Thermoprotei archaeon]